MKQFRTGLLASILPGLFAASYMADGEASNSGQTAPDASAPVTGTAPAEAEAARKRAAASNFLPIVRGRLPLLFVHAVRFDPVIGKMGNKDAAGKFGTSVGKVFDIKKGRNFAYIGEGWKPSTDDIAAAEAWIAQIGAENAKGLTSVGDKAMLQSVLDQYKQRGLASAEEAAAQSAARAPAFKKASTPATGTGGGSPLPGGEAVQTMAASAADDLLN